MPVPEVKPEELFSVRPPRKVTPGFWPERSQTPPLLMVTAPINNLVPVLPVAVSMVPVNEVAPVMVRAKLPMVSLAPEPTVKVPLTTLAAPLVQTAVPVMLTLPPTVVKTVVAVAEPLILKLLLTVVTLVMVLAPEPDNPKVL